MDSNMGNAINVPKPLRKVRRGTEFRAFINNLDRSFDDSTHTLLQRKSWFGS